MDTITINFKASGQNLTADAHPQRYASNTVNYIQAVFDLDENWQSFDSVRAVWHNDFACISTVLDGDGACAVPHEVLTNLDEVIVNLVGSDVDGEELVDRMTTYPLRVAIIDAHARICGTETAEVTPSQFEQYIAIVEQIVGTVKDIDHTELTDDYCLIIYYSDGTNSGKLGPIRGATGATGNGIVSAVLNADYTLTLTYDNGDSDTVGPIRGAQGKTGNGIESVYLTETHGAVKTYTILFTDGTTTTFDVTDGEVTLAQLEQVLPTDTASGAIASFPDGSDLFDYLSCIVNIDPVQDLHGYDKPWVGGAGKNKFNVTATTQTVNGITFTVHDDGTVTVNGTATDQANLFLNATGANLVNGTEYIINGCPTGGGVNAYGLWAKNDGITDYGSGATFTYDGSAIVGRIRIASGTVCNNLLFKPMIRLSTVSDGTFAPYSNICPITGWTGCEVTKTGFNLVNVSDAMTNAGFTEQSDGSWYVQYSSTTYNKLLWKNVSGAEGRICVTFDYKYSSASNDGAILIIVYKDGTTSYCGHTPTQTFTKSTTVSTTGKIVDRVYFSYGSGSVSTYIKNLCVNWSDANKNGNYEPYNGTTYPVSWQTEAGTVYGGTVDLVTGVLTAYPYYTSYNGETLVGPWVSSMDEYVQGTTPTTGAQVVDLGGTPTTYQLTPTQIHALLGQNNVWADCGDVEVQYKADVQRWVEKMLDA